MRTTAWRDVRRLLRLLKPHPLLLPLLAALGLAASLAEALGIGVLIPLVGAALSGSELPGGAMAAAARRLIVTAEGSLHLGALSLLVLGLVAAKTLTLVAYEVVSTRTTARIERNLRVDLWERVINAELGWFSRADHGEIHIIFDRQVWRVGEALSAFNRIIVASCAIVVYGVGFVLLSPPMAALTLAMAVPLFFLVRRVTTSATRAGEALTAGYAGVAGRISELLGTLRTIRLFNRQAAETRRFAAEADALRAIFLRTELLNRLTRPILELLYLPLFLVVLAYALANGTGPGVMLAFLLLLFRLQAPLRSLDAARMTLATCSPAVADVDALLSAVPDERTRSGSAAVPALSHGIDFRDVRFTYPGADAPALDGLDVQFRHGEIVAVIGPSGAGKSTMVNLLFGLYRPDSGAVLVDQVPLDSLDLGAWRERTAFAGQDSDLLGGTVRFNLAYGAPTPPDEGAIRVTAEAVGADHFIAALPAGYETNVGLRGGLLSGGQRQRIALGRALLRRPDVLVLDEATNAVDTETEVAIHHTIAALRGKATVLIIAHRSSTLAHVDRVLLLERGRITEDAPPSRLSVRAAQLSGLAAAT